MRRLPFGKTDSRYERETFIKLGEKAVSRRGFISCVFFAHEKGFIARMARTGRIKERDFFICVLLEKLFFVSYYFSHEL